MENNNNKITPKDALINLFKSVQTPLIFFAVGYATCFYFQAKSKRKQIGS